MTAPVIASTKTVYVTPDGPVASYPLLSTGTWNILNRPHGAPCLIENTNPTNVYLYVPGVGPVQTSQNFINPNLICYDDTGKALVEFRGDGTISIAQLYPNIQTLIGRILPVPSAWSAAYNQFQMETPTGWARPGYIYPSASFSGRGGNFGVSYPGGGGFYSVSLAITDLLGPMVRSNIAVSLNYSTSNFGIAPNIITTLPGKDVLYVIDAAVPTLDSQPIGGHHFIGYDLSDNANNITLPAVNSSFCFGALFNGYMVSGPPNNSPGAYYTEDFVNLHPLIDGNGIVDFANFTNSWAGGLTSAWGAQHMFMASDPTGGLSKYPTMSLITLEKVTINGNPLWSGACGCGM